MNPTPGVVRVFSDLHLAEAGSWVRQLSDLAPLFEGADAIVLNGDTLEARFPEKLPFLREREAALRTFLAEQRLPIALIAGNHDPLISEVTFLDLAGGRVFATHGDLLFPGAAPWCPQAEPIARAHRELLARQPPERRDDLPVQLATLKRACLAGYLPEEALLHGASGFAAVLLRQLWPPSKPFKIVRAWAETPGRGEALLRRHRPRAQALLIGHTHRSGVWRRPSGRWIINTGALAGGAHPLAVDVTSGRLVVREILRARGGALRLAAKPRALIDLSPLAEPPRELPPVAGSFSSAP